MKLLICGSDDIGPEYMFFADDKTYYLEDIFDDIIDEIEETTGNEVKFLTRGSNSGIDAFVNLYCEDTGIELDERRPVNKLEDNASIYRDVQLVNEADALLMFIIKYQKYKGTDLHNISQMMEERGKPVYVFTMEKFS